MAKWQGREALVLPREQLLLMDGINNPSDYRPDYIERIDFEFCPHCGYSGHRRTNRYLFRCTNSECGRYW